AGLQVIVPQDVAFATWEEKVANSPPTPGQRPPRAAPGNHTVEGTANAERNHIFPRHGPQPPRDPAAGRPPPAASGCSSAPTVPRGFATAAPCAASCGASWSSPA